MTRQAELYNNTLVCLEGVLEKFYETFDFIDQNNGESDFDELDQVFDDTLVDLLNPIVDLVNNGFVPQNLTIYQRVLDYCEGSPDILNVPKRDWEKFVKILLDRGIILPKARSTQKPFSVSVPTDLHSLNALLQSIEATYGNMPIQGNIIGGDNSRALSLCLEDETEYYDDNKKHFILDIECNNEDPIEDKVTFYNHDISEEDDKMDIVDNAVSKMLIIEE